METSDARKRKEEAAAEPEDLTPGVRVACQYTGTTGVVQGASYVDGVQTSITVRFDDGSVGAYDVPHGFRRETSDEALALLRKKLGQDGPGYDTVAQPEHYTHSGIEVWDAIDAWGLGYRLGNVIKYVARADRKGNPIQDLRKALAYLTRELDVREQDARDL